MIGDRLQQIARHLVREETYARIVTPAIADLQYEARSCRCLCVSAYAGAWRALIAAMAQEVAGDCLATVTAVHPRSALGPAAATLMCLTTLMVAPMAWRATRSPLPWHYEAVLMVVMALPTVLTFTMPAAALPFAATYARLPQPGAKRAALFATSVALFMLMAGNHVLKQRLEPLWRELRIAAIESMRYSELQGRPLWEVRNALRSDIDAIAARNPGAAAGTEIRAVRERHQSLAMMLMGMTCALCGISWRRRGPVALVCLAVGVSAAHLVLMFVFTGLLYVQRVSGYAASVWSPVLLLFLTAWLLALRSSEARA
jgi:hypothetical protein